MRMGTLPSSGTLIRVERLLTMSISLARKHVILGICKFQNFEF